VSVATGLAIGSTPTSDLATQAVAQAMQRAGVSHANSVLLFLSADFAHDPQPALLAASRQSQCMQIVGCSAAGIFTEQDWVLDSPAAAAMVFGGELNLSAAHTPTDNDLILALTAPNAIDTNWISAPGQRLGAVSGDATGRGPYKVWSGGKVCASGRCEMTLQGVRGMMGVSQGIRALTAPTEVTQVNGFDLLSLGRQSALNLLARELPLEVRELDRIPLHLIMAAVTFGEPSTAFFEGRYRLVQVIATNPDDRSVTLSARLNEGDKVFWALRQPLAAERNMRVTLDRTEQLLAATPQFGLMFSSMGRGPSFYGGIDRDLQLLTTRYPDMPLIGFYGNGEIGWLNSANQLLQYSTVLGLFTDHV
jgi:small ligand-binding sensory domain FIST